MWTAWLDEQWNIPTRDNHYSMLIACQVARVLSSAPQRIQPDQFKLSFGLGKQQFTKEQEEQHLRNLKAMRAASLGGMDRMTIFDKDGKLVRGPIEKPRGKRGALILPRGSQGVNNADTNRVRNPSNQVHRGESRPISETETVGGCTTQSSTNRRRI